MKKEQIIPKLTGTIFLIFGITAIINQLLENNLPGILWFCYTGLIIMGIGFLLNNKTLIKSQLNILLIPLIFWTIDFLSIAIFKENFLGITNYFFEFGKILPKIITSQHLFTIPLAIYALRFITGKSKHDRIFSIIQITIIYIITKALTLQEKNINWIYKTSLDVAIPYYSLAWFGTVILMIFLSNKILKV